MRGADLQQAAMWSHLSPEARVPNGHPLRPIRRMTDLALAELDPLFRKMSRAVAAQRAASTARR